MIYCKLIFAQISVSTTPVTSCANANGKATITVANVASGFTFEYAVDGTYSNSNVFENLTAGDHVATVRDKTTKCTFTKDFTIEDQADLKLSISGTGFNTFCIGQPASATLTATASGGSGNYSYSWPGGTKVVSSSGWYSVTATDNVSGCTKSSGGFVIFIPVICSRDPNDIIGPEGYGPGKMVSKFAQMPYTIRFENDPVFATAPAQIVKITNPLDSNLNALSFRLGDFGFGGLTFTVPPNRSFYTARLDVLDSLGVVVDVTAGIDITKREAFWIFEAKDPVTGLPPTLATLGFLPVNDTVTRKGEGFVNYTIKPAVHTQTGDTVHAAASIIFDINAPLATPAIFNTIDAVSPTSQVQPMPVTIDTNSIVVSWSGRDDIGGSGVRFYDLFVSESGGPYVSYRSGITDTFTTFIGRYGFTYDFYSIATDNTGNRETSKLNGEQRVIINSNLPKPNIGPDTILRKCPGVPVNLNSPFILTGLFAVWNTSTDTAQVAPGVFTLVVNDPNGMKDTAVVTVADYAKPALGSDTTLGHCPGYTINIDNIYNTTGYASVQWSATNPSSVSAGTYTLMVTNAFGCSDTAVVTVVTNAKPGLGSDTALSVCTGATTSITNLYDTTGYANVLWSTANPANVGAGVYNLTVTNNLGCKDTAIVTVVDRPIPNLGNDTIIPICAGPTVHIGTLYDTSSYALVQWSTARPDSVGPGTYTLSVASTYGCKDTVAITVVAARIASVPTVANLQRPADRECTDTSGWTHYFNNNGTPLDYTDDIRLLSLKKNGNNIGTVGDGTFQLTVGTTAIAGSGNATKVTSPFVPLGADFYSMNRYWNITPTNQPTSNVPVRFYYNTKDIVDINGDYPPDTLPHILLNMYKLAAGNPNPSTNWANATAVGYYQHDSLPTLSKWVYTPINDSLHQAEFLVSNFSGGGAGVIYYSVIPVTGLSFDLRLEKDRVKLLWKTLTEINSKNFIVERSIEGGTFEALDTVAASGNSNVPKDYSFDDMPVMEQKGKTIFYRIYQLDIDGRGKYSDVKRIVIPAGKNKLVLLYNPVNQEAVLKYDCTTKDKATIRVFNQLGQLVIVNEVIVSAGVNQLRLNTAALSKGIYEVELISANDFQRVRMVKE